MPHFFFDTLCGDHFMKDTLGLDLGSLEDAVAMAREGLGELARDAVPVLEDGTIAMWLRDAEDHVVFTASLKLESNQRPF